MSDGNKNTGNSLLHCFNFCFGNGEPERDKYGILVVDKSKYGFDDDVNELSQHSMEDVNGDDNNAEARESRARNKEQYLKLHSNYRRTTAEKNEEKVIKSANKVVKGGAAVGGGKTPSSRRGHQSDIPHQNKETRNKIFAKPLEEDDLKDWKPPFYKKSKETFNKINDALSDNFIFDSLDEEERTLLINAMERETFKRDSIIINQGDKIDDKRDNNFYFYVVETGYVSFYVDGNDVGCCQSGGCFGELALLYDAPRAATCKATNKDCIVWKLDQVTFKKLLAHKNQAEEKELYNILSKIPMFDGCDDEIKNKIADAVTLATYRKDESIIKKGDMGDIFYIIKDGKVKVHDIGFGSSKFDDQILQSGDWFGEYSLMKDEPRMANVTAISDITNVYALSRTIFCDIFGSIQDVMELSQKIKYLRAIPLLNTAEPKLDYSEYKSLIDKFEETSYKAGTTIIKEGEIQDPSRLYVIDTGRIILNHEGTIYRLSDSDYFSASVSKFHEDKPEPSQRTIICDTDTTMYEITKPELLSVIGSLDRLDRFYNSKSTSVRDVKTSSTGDSVSSYLKEVPPSYKPITIDDIIKHKILGMGAFGKVWLASSKSSRKSFARSNLSLNGTRSSSTATSKMNTVNRKDGSNAYALKVLDKRQLLEAQQVKGVIREKNILASLYSIFILDLVSAFQDENSLYLLTELYAGGELFNVIHTDKRDGLPMHNAKFYAACVLEGLSYLHQRSIVYRDLKPENVLINSMGYCVIVDMGFAKVINDNKTYTLCGTPEYLPPEIIMSKGHDLGCDYWSFGVLIYEMIVGSSPFMHRFNLDQHALFKNIIMLNYSFPKYIKNHGDEKYVDFMDIVNKLLVRKNSQRLGKLVGGIDDIKNHSWFKSDVNFDKLQKGEIKAPWIPKVDNPLDKLDNFDSNSFRSEEREAKFKDVIPEEDQALFESF